MVTEWGREQLVRGRMGRETGFSGDGWGWVPSLLGWMGIGINYPPRAALYSSQCQLFTTSKHIDN